MWIYIYIYLWLHFCYVWQSLDKPTACARLPLQLNVPSQLKLSIFRLAKFDIFVFSGNVSEFTATFCQNLPFEATWLYNQGAPCLVKNRLMLSVCGITSSITCFFIGVRILCTTRAESLSTLCVSQKLLSLFSTLNKMTVEMHNLFGGQ